MQGLRAIGKTSKNFKDSSLKYFIALVEFSIFTHMIHVSYIYLRFTIKKSTIHVGKYASPVDGMGV